MSQNHIVSIVLNGVVGDSRVLKTARAARLAGYRATVVGMGAVSEVTRLQVEGTDVILVPNPVKDLLSLGLWPKDKNQRNLWPLVEGALKAMAPVILNDLKPDLLHSHDMSGLRVGASISRMLAMQGRRVPWVHDLHEYVIGLTTVPEKYRLSSIEYERRYLRQADHLITVSDRLAVEVKSHYSLRKVPTVIYNAPEKMEVLDGRDVRTEIGIKTETPLVVYIGVAKKERGCETLVEAVANMPEVHICFVSDSAYVDQLKIKASELGMGSRIHSVPYVPSGCVSSYIRTADVGMHGLIHYPNGEVALPNKLFEYLHARLPIVVSDVAEMKRFTMEHEIGEVFEAENAVSCASALRAVLENKERYTRNITNELRSEYCWDTQATKLANIYESLLSDAVSRKPRCIVLGSGRWNMEDAKRRLSSTGSNIDTGVIAAVAPAYPVDFYADRTTKGDQAGLVSMLAQRYVRIFYEEGIFSGPEVRALSESGIDMQLCSVSSGTAEPGERPDTVALLQSIECEREVADRANLEAVIQAECSLAAKQSANNVPQLLLELKVANKKIKRLTVTIKEQRKKLEALDVGARPNGQDTSFAREDFKPSKRFAALARNFFAPKSL